MFGENGTLDVGSSLQERESTVVRLTELNYHCPTINKEVKNELQDKTS